MFFLLFVYSISFGHQVISHHHHDNEGHNHNNLKEHHHCLKDNTKHQHVAHKDHFDEGIFDFIACVLGNHSHESHENCYDNYVLNDQKTGKSSYKKEFKNICFLVQNNLDIIIDTRVNSFVSINFESNALNKEKSKRGPPIAFS